MTRVVLSIGSNLGDRLAHLGAAVAAVRPVAVSPVYETAPWGPVAQGDYLNAVLIADDPARDAESWFALAMALEQSEGRTREVRWGPRTLDVDLIQVTDGDSPVISADPRLTLPHPRAHQRAFVLLPWTAVEPDAVLTGHGPVAGLAARLDADERAGVHRRDDLRMEEVRR